AAQRVVGEALSPVGLAVTGFGRGEGVGGGLVLLRRDGNELVELLAAFVKAFGRGVEFGYLGGDLLRPRVEGAELAGGAIAAALPGGNVLRDLAEARRAHARRGLEAAELEAGLIGPGADIGEGGLAGGGEGGG